MSTKGKGHTTGTTQKQTQYNFNNRNNMTHVPGCPSAPTIHQHLHFNHKHSTTWDNQKKKKKKKTYLVTHLPPPPPPPPLPILLPLFPLSTTKKERETKFYYHYVTYTTVNINMQNQQKFHNTLLTFSSPHHHPHDFPFLHDYNNKSLQLIMHNSMNHLSKYHLEIKVSFYLLK